MDILTSAARLDGSRDRPLSANRLSVMLQCLSIINSRETMHMMDLGQRQAQRYVRVAKFVLPPAGQFLRQQASQ